MAFLLTPGQANDLVGADTLLSQMTAERGHSGIAWRQGGGAVQLHVRRVLGEMEAPKSCGGVSGAGDVDETRLGGRLPPIGTPLLALLYGWRTSVTSPGRSQRSP